MRYLIGIICMCFFLGHGHAAIEQVSARATGSGIAILPAGSVLPYSLKVADQQRSFMMANAGWSNRFGVKAAKVDVMLRYTDARRYFNATGTWTLDVEYDIKLYNAPGASSLYTTLSAQHASINYSAAGTYGDIFLKSYANAYGAELTVKNITYTEGGNPAVTTLPSYRNNDIYLELMQQTERYYNLFYTGASPAVVVGTPVTVSYATPSNLANNTLPVTWNYLEGAESYDLEWLFIDAGDAGTGPFGNAYEVDFAKATRVNVVQQYYNIPMAYPKGILLYRVRPVGISHQSPYTARTEGAWSAVSASATSISMSSANSSSFRIDFSGLDGTYNWQATTSFAEEGKRKEVVSYFDGSLRNRQSVTLLNTDNNAIIAETKYDFQGRPTVSMLPTPLSSTGIHYYSGFNSFDKNSFDVDANFPVSSATVSTSDQTGKYYGADNTATGLDALVSDARGYPYTQTLYKKDGRVSAQSGVGFAHRLGYGHDTRYFYGSPTAQAELDRLFGNEVGDVSHYKKNMVVDANGQASVSYLDQEGRTVATALVGSEASNNLLDLEGRPAPTAMSVDMLTGRNFRVDNARHARSALLVESPGKSYAFVYTLNHDTACATPPCPSGFCRECAFDLSIRVTDEDGALVSGTVTAGPVVLPLVANPNAPSGYTITPGKAELTCTNITAATYSVNITFAAIGTYYVDKLLTVSNAQLENQYAEEFVAAYEPCAGLPTVSPEPCQDCAFLCNNQYKVTDAAGQPILTNGQPTWTDAYGVVLQNQADGPALLQACLNNCNAPVVNLPDECTLRRLMLMQDMSPGGQYFDNVQDNIPLCSPTPTCSPATAVAGNQNDWLIRFISPNEGSAGANATFWNAFRTMLTGTSSPCSTVPAPPASITWDWIRANWNDCMAQFFYKYHPEYCTFSYFCDNDRVLCQSGSTVYTMGMSLAYDKAMKNATTNASSYYTNLASPYTTLANKTDLVQYAPATGITQIRDPYFQDCNEYACADRSTVSMAATMSQYLRNYILAFDCPSCYSGSSVVSYSCSSCATFPMSIWYVLEDPNNITVNGATALSGLGVAKLDPNTVNMFRQLHGYGGQPGILSASFTKYDYYETVYQQYKQLLVYAALAGYTNCPAPSPSTSTNHFLSQDPASPTFATCCHNLPRAQIRMQANPLYDIAIQSCPPAFDASAMAAIIDTVGNHPSVSECQSTCEGYADAWMQEIYSKLSLCSPAELLSAADSANMRQYLVQICAGSCDYTNPQGTSSTTLSVGPGLHTFGDVYNHFLNNPSTYPAYACQLALDNINIQHPPQQGYSQENCVCSNIRSLAFANNISWTDPNLAARLYALIVDSLGVTSPVTQSDVANWISTCKSGTPDPTVFFPQSGNSIPDVLSCPSSDEAPEDPNACQEQAQSDAGYFNTLIRQQLLDQKRREYKAGYIGTCLDKALNNESLVASYTLDEYYYTLYYFDQAGNLIKTVPPKGFVPIPVSNTAGTALNPTTKDAAQYRAWSSNGGTMPANGFVWPKHQMPTGYQYTTLNQPNWQTTPDGGMSRFWYDALGRLVVSQNAKQLASTQVLNKTAYSYTLYDELSRIGEVGEMYHNVAMADAISRDRDPLTTAAGNDLQAWISAGSNKHQVTRTFYDEQPAQSGYLSTNALALYTAGSLSNLRNRVATVTYAEDPAVANYNTASHYSYDIHGNVKTLYQEDIALQSLGYDINRLDYDYDLVSGKVNEVHYNNGKPDQFHHRYAYDADNRLTIACSSRDGVIWEKEAKYFYYKHGPLARTEIGDKQVQAADYAYTAHGWIKGVNSDMLSQDKDMGKDGKAGTLHYNFANDAFGYSLNYFKTDYRAKNTAYGSFVADEAPASLLSTVAPDLFNGNISSMGASITDLGGNALPMLRGFQYDQLNRIRYASALEGVTSANAWTNTAFGQKYKEEFHYDLNGNITSLKRNGNNTGALVMDDLTYTYEHPASNSSYTATTNKLRHVNDTDPNAATYSDDLGDQGSLTVNSTENYTYDAIGNLTRDVKENISNIDWTVYGKIRSITKTGTRSDLEFVYDPTGNRVQKIEKTKDGSGVLNPSTKWNTTYYVRDAQGNVMAVYKRAYNLGTAQSEFSLAEQHIYGSSRLGMATPNLRLDQSVTPSGFSLRLLGQKAYETSNHLGNVMAVVSDRKLAVDGNGDGIIDYFRADVLSSSDYYAFGSPQPGRSFSTSSYRYGFNGKENDPETVGTTAGLQDYGMRIYNPALGKFLSVDPLQSDYPWWSPYHFAGCSPIENIDLDGLETYNYRLITSEKTGLSKLELVNVEHGSLCNTLTVQRVEYKGGIYTIDCELNYAPYHGFLKVGELNGLTPTQLENYFKDRLTDEQAAAQTRAEDEQRQEEYANAIYTAKYAQSRVDANKTRKPGTTPPVENKPSNNKPRNGADRAQLYSSSWGKASLENAVNKFAPGSIPVTVGGKILYTNSKTGIQVVYDISGNYFRIENTLLTGKRNYIDFSGTIPNNTVENGKIRGRSQAEYNSVTHFNNTDPINNGNNSNTNSQNQ